jgi:hypothetical protein
MKNSRPLARHGAPRRPEARFLRSKILISAGRRTISFGLPGCAVLVVLSIGVAALIAYLIAVETPAQPRPPAVSHHQPAISAPTSPPVRACGATRLLAGPSSPPRGAVTVPAGDDSAVQFNPDTTYWFAPGKHTIGTGSDAQIQPEDKDTFIGAPGAILSGQGENQFAFIGTSTNVTIEYLTIEGFAPLGNEAAVNRDSGKGWVISHDTIRDNSPGGGLMMGSDNKVTYNCLARNGQFGFGAYLPPASSDASRLTGGPINITFNHNEVSYNDTCNFEDKSPDPVPASYVPSNCSGAGESAGCGCSGGGKFWRVENATVDDNYVHDNYNVGLWSDTDNDGFEFEFNYIENNDIGIQYEISYNAIIEHNTFIGNAVQGGPATPAFPSAAIYISESGGNSHVPNAMGISTLTIMDNVFTNNWSGVVLWEDANRFCGSPNNPSADICTLDDPAVANIHSCDQAHLVGATPHGNPDYYDLCRWKTQNVLVANNLFNMKDSAVPSCKGSANSCGENGIFSQDGTSPSWSPYLGPNVANAITESRNNHFRNNTYTGKWRYMYSIQGTVLSFAQWQEKGQD